MRVGKDKRRRAILAGVVVIAVGIFGLSTVERLQKTASSARLVSIKQLPDLGEMCLWEPASANSSRTGASQGDNLFAAFQEGPVYAASQDAGQTGDVGRPPVRNIRDTDPIYTAVTVDTRLDEVLLQDTNTWSIRVFNRLDNTPPNANRTEPKRLIGGPKTDAPNANRTEPKRLIGGPKTDVQFNSCVYVDPKNGDIYSVENDIGDSIVVFSHDANGDVEPIRKLKITHRGYAMTVDEENQELFLSVQYPPQVAVYRKTASGDEKPLRLLQGESTRLSDAHGIAIDTKNRLLFVNNWGNISDYSIAGTSRFEAPSITVYPLNVNGDTSPLRVIQGPKTQLNWPGAMSVDPERGELYVANDVGKFEACPPS